MNTLCTVVMFNQALIKCLTYFSCSVHAFVSNTVGLIGIGDVHVENTLNFNRQIPFGCRFLRRCTHSRRLRSNCGNRPHVCVGDSCAVPLLW